MKLQNIFRLQKLYYIFFVRQVLSIGILKEKLFRAIALLVTTAFVIGATIFLYYIFDETLVVENLDLMLFIIRMQGLNIVVWTAIIFLFLKLLFLRKGSFLKMTFQLPITMKERSASLLLFELNTAMAVVILVSISHTFAILLRTHFSYALLLICAVIFTSLAFYLILQLLYVLISYCLKLLKLEKLRLFFVILIFTGILYLLYQDITESVLSSNDFSSITHWSQLFITLYEQYNFILSFLIFIFLFIVSTVAIVLIPNHSYIDENLYFKIKGKPIKRNFNLFNVYFMQVFRRIENYATVGMTYLFFIFLLITNITHPLNVLFLNITSGIYIYIQTDKIRMLHFKLQYSALKDYCCLIVSQMSYIIITSLPILFGYLMFNLNEISILFLRDIVTIYFNVLLGIILTTMIGILFPAKKENPFSPIVGTVIVVIMMVSMVLILQFLQLEPLLISIITICSYILVIYLSWLGLVKLQEEIVCGKN